METIIAQRGGVQVYLVQTGATTGRVLDVERGVYYPEHTLLSITARGYWQPLAVDTPPLATLLAQVHSRGEAAQ